MPFFKRQQKIVLENCGKIDPERIEDYIAEGGHGSPLQRPENDDLARVIEQMVRSGLRGRGGAGFPTGLKWTAVSKAASSTKFVICKRGRR
jgi:bidirectional [NiFe] hydrogenase diaphorase subunit